MEITTLSLRQILKAVWEDTKALVNPATWKSLFTGKDSILEFGERYPVLTRHGESNIHNLFIIGNLSGEPDIKAALNQGVLAARYLYEKCLKGKKKEKDIWPVLIIGGGPAGVAAALELEKQGVDYLVLEKSELFTTVRKFEKDLPLFYAKTGLKHVLSDLEFHDSVTHKILSEWDDWMKEHPIKVKIGEQVKDILKQGGRFAVKAAEGAQYEAQHVILAVGKLVLLNKLQVAEEKGCVTKENVEVTQLPQDMLCRIPLRFERTFGWKTWIWFFSWVSLIGLFYTLKKIHPQFGNFNLGSFYPWLYTGVVWIFGIKAILRYRDSLQTKKYLSPVFFQTTFFSVIPEVILHHWQAYSLLYAWPLGLSPVTVQSFLQSPQKFYFWWTVILSFVLLPVFVMFTGKQYCSWICGCGGLAETLGDKWRHYRPGGKVNSQRERQIFYVMTFAVIATLWAMLKVPGENFIKTLYSWTVDFALIAVIPVSLYPFLGGKIWCRYWCPTAGFMHLISAWFTKKGRSHYAILPRKERCIACNLCTRYCEVGIDVRKFALKGETLTNLNSSCIGCGLCVSVCPTDVLKLNTIGI